MRTPQPDDTRTTLRLPADLKAALTAIADREGRSLHAQMLYLLRHAVDQDRRGHPPS